MKLDLRAMVSDVVKDEAATDSDWLKIIALTLFGLWEIEHAKLQAQRPLIVPNPNLRN